jgi:RHS repeat-associated protein
LLRCCLPAALIALVVAAFFFASAASAANTAPYAAPIDLGAFPYRSSVWGRTADARGINNLEQVVGTAAVPLPYGNEAYVYDNTGVHLLGFLANESPSSYGLALSDRGDVVGLSTSHSSFMHGFFLLNGFMLDLMPEWGGRNTWLNDVNGRGQAVGSIEGWLFGPNGGQHAVLVDNGAVTDLGALGGSEATLFGINDSGRMVGVARMADGLYHAVAGATVGGFTDLGAGPDSYAWAISNTGIIVGARGPFGVGSPFVVDASGLRTLPLLGRTGTAAGAFAVNDDGVIVGSADLKTGAKTSESHAVMWKDGQIVDLNSFVPDGSGWLLTHAEGINDKGQIVGDGVLNGVGHSWVLSPVGVPWDPKPFANLPRPVPFTVPIGVPQTYGSCGAALHAANPTACQTDPVNSATGSFMQHATDASLPGAGVAFALSRSYTSGDPRIGLLGLGWTSSFEVSLTPEEGGVVVLTAEDGQQVVYTPRADGTYAATGGRSVLTQRDSGWELMRQDHVRYAFDLDGKIVSETDANGNGLTFGRDLLGRIGSVTDSAGRTATFSYGGNGLLASVALPDGRTVAYGYSIDESLTSVTGLDGSVTHYTYDAAGLLTDVVDANGHTVVHNEYGPDGRVVAQTDAAGNTSQFAWHAATQTAALTDARGNTWKDVYDNNVLVKKIDPLGNTTSYTYDENLNPATVTDARGKVTTTSYDADGHLVGSTAPAPQGYTTTLAYDNGRLASKTDGRGNTKTYDYDAAGNLVAVHQPDGTTLRYEYDHGNLVAQTDAAGKTARFTRDPSGLVLRSVTATGAVTTFAYDPSGRLVSRAAPRGDVTAYTYDDADRLLRTTDPLGHVTSLAYDAVGNLLSKTDANGHVTRYRYDNANRVVEIIAPDGGSTLQAYDATGNLLARTNAGGKTTRYAFDAVNRLVAKTDPLGRRWTYAYDAAGNRVKMVSPSGGTTTYSYDSLDRLIAVAYSDGTPTVRYAYDGAGNRTSMGDGSGGVSYTYDAMNRLTSVTRGSDVFSYAYDDAGRIVSRVYPDGSVVGATYDDDGRLASVTADGGTTAYTWDVAGNLVATSLPDGTGEARFYDAAGRLTGVRSGTSFSNVRLDSVGNPLAVATEAGTSTYRYDAADRVTEVCYTADCAGPGSFIRYAYDAAGNKTSETRAAGTTEYSYDAAGELLAQTGPNGAVSYPYDANGNQTTLGGATLAFNLAGELVSATRGAKTTLYAYDGDGLRVSAGKTDLLWDVGSGAPSLALERSGRKLDARFVYGVGPLALSTSSAYYHLDALGNVIKLAGSKTLTYAYEPFGALRSTNDDRGKNALRFDGQLWDDAVGAYYLRARDYDPATGRFLQPDPIEDPAGRPFLSDYVYAADNPLVLDDPLGTCPDWLCGTLAAIGDAATAAVKGTASAVERAGRGVGTVAQAAWDHREEILLTAAVAGTTFCVFASGGAAAPCDYAAYALIGLTQLNETYAVATGRISPGVYVGKTIVNLPVGVSLLALRSLVRLYAREWTASWVQRLLPEATFWIPDTALMTLSRFFPSGLEK